MEVENRKVVTSWKLHWILDLILLLVPIALVHFHLVGMITPLLLMPVALSLFNQFSYLHEASHRRGAWVQAAGHFAGALLFLPLPLFGPHHIIHHQNTHMIGKDNAWHPVEDGPAWKQIGEFLFRSLLIGFALIITILLCLRDQFNSDFTARRILRASKKTAILSVLIFIISSLILILIFRLCGWAGLFWIWILPLFLAHSVFAAITLVQHHHHENPFRSEVDGDRVERSIELTNHLLFPDWFHFLTHSVHFHVAHHIWPSEPYPVLRHRTESLLASYPNKLRAADFSFALIYRAAIESTLSRADGCKIELGSRQPGRKT